jgi:hypothetical protein
MVRRRLRIVLCTSFALPNLAIAIYIYIKSGACCAARPHVGLTKRLLDIEADAAQSVALLAVRPSLSHAEQGAAAICGYLPRSAD